MDQFHFDFGPNERAKEHDRILMRAITEAVRSVGAEKFCIAANAQPSVISEALNGPRPGRQERPWQMRWTCALLDMPELPREHKAAILSALTGRCGYEIAPARKLTPEERVRLLEEKVRETFGKAGEKLLAEVSQ